MARPKRWKNPKKLGDSLEILEKIQKAREVYSQTKNLLTTSIIIGVSKPIIKEWVSDLFDKVQTEFNNIKAAAIKLCAETDLSYEAIGEEFGYTGAAVRNWCQEAQINNERRHSRRNFLNDIKLKAQELCRTTSYTYQQITDILNKENAAIDPSQVWRWCRNTSRPEKVDPLKARAQELWRKTGLTKSEIAATLKVPKGTLPGWFKNIPKEETLNSETIKYLQLLDPRVGLARKYYLETKSLHATELKLRQDGYPCSNRAITRWIFDLLPPTQKIYGRNPNSPLRGISDLKKLELIAEARRLFLKFKSAHKVSNLMGVHYPTVRQWVKDLQIKHQWPSFYRTKNLGKFSTS